MVMFIFGKFMQDCSWQHFMEANFDAFQSTVCSCYTKKNINSRMDSFSPFESLDPDTLE